MEDLSRSEVDEMLMLTAGEDEQENLDTGDEVEELRNSLREVVHDDTVQPKMQCLMMDTSFSMVAMQGEDSGIAWETTPSRCATPWASEAGYPTAELSTMAAATGSHPAGKIIFVMDEELMTRRKKVKDSTQKNKADKQRRSLVESFDNISGRPELVEVSQPNVRLDDEGVKEEVPEQLVDRDQMLFSLVSEGSEILNIIVPPKIATVDEEESNKMEDNLSYLEETHRPTEDSTDQDYDLSNDLTRVTDALRRSVAGEHVRHLVRPNIMDPPGAPVARPLGRGAAGSEDYFEAFSLVDAQAPGGPAITPHEEGEPAKEGYLDTQERPVQLPPAILDHEKSETVSLEGINAEHMDEVFYGGNENLLSQSPQEKEDTVKVVRLPSKPSGSTLFGSQEDILTPIYLPEGPPKIIDPILLEEPKAMAFLYTDLYEEALGNRVPEEDAESLSSEKSFHSRQSDREARGYLEKYALIDETPVVEVESTAKEEGPGEDPRVLTQDLFDFGSFLSKLDKGEIPESEEEITDFFRSSANSSPCDIEPFPRSQEEDTTQASVTKRKLSTSKAVTIQVDKVPEAPLQPISLPDLELLSDDWESTDDYLTASEQYIGRTDPDKQGGDAETLKPVAPPRRKTPAAPKACLDLTPLTPVDVLEKEDTGSKEQKEEEKEKASPAETADEGEEDEVTQSPTSDFVESFHTETVEMEQERKEVRQETEPESDKGRVDPEKPKDTSSTEQVKDKGNCIIL